MNKKQLFYLQFILKAGVSLFLFSLPFWVDFSENEYGKLLAILFSLLFAFLSYRDYKKHELANDVDMPYKPPFNSSLNVQNKFYKKYIYIGSIAFLILTVIVISDLNDIESGQTESINTFAPVVFVYNKFGYWPAVLTVPILGVVCLVMLFRKIKDTNREN